MVDPAHELTHPDGPVDDKGKPEGPVEQAVEKSKNNNRAKAGLALAAIGIIVAIYLARHRSGGTVAAPAASGVPGAAPGPIDPNTGQPMGGSGIDTSYIQNLQGSLGGLSSQLADYQSHSDATAASIAAAQTGQTGAIQGLSANIAALVAVDNRTAPEHQAQPPIVKAPTPPGGGPTSTAPPAKPAKPPIGKAIAAALKAPPPAAKGTTTTAPKAKLTNLAAGENFGAAVLGGRAPLPAGVAVPTGYTLNANRTLTKR